MTDLTKLREPFPPDRISWRVGSTTADKTRGMALAYIDARDVQDRLDVICGPAGWQCRYHLLGVTTVCELGIRQDNEWVWKADGAGATDFEGEKGALSDAFKRAAVKWGIGRYLYDVDAPWVAIKGAGKSFKIEDGELPKLRALLGGKAAPQLPPVERAAIKQAERELSDPNGDVANGISKPRTTKQYGVQARAEVRALKTLKEMKAWEARNDADLAKLQKADLAEFNDVQAEMSHAYHRLSPLAVG